MKIGLVVYGSLETITGGNLYDRLLVKGLRARGDQVEILSLPSRDPLNILLHEFQFQPPAELDVLIQDELTHASLLIPNQFRHKQPVVTIVHNLHSLERRPAWQNALFRRIEREYLRSVDGVIANSDSTLRSIHISLGVEKPSVVAPPGGDRLGGLPVQAVKARAARRGPLRLLFLANVTPVKGLEILLRALETLDPGLYELDVVGSCEMEPRYARQLALQAGLLGARIHFHGSLDGEPLVRLLADADVMVIPSFYEGFGIAFAEGMAFGLPAIGTRVGAVPNTITHGVNGYLIQPGDAAALAGHISSLASDRALLARLSTAASEDSFARPTWDDAVESIRSFLTSFL